MKREFGKAMYSVVRKARERARSKRRPLDLTISIPNDLDKLELVSQL